MSPICGHSTSDAQIRPVLSVLVEDPDRDVRFFASHALEALDKLAASSSSSPTSYDMNVKESPSVPIVSNL